MHKRNNPTKKDISRQLITYYNQDYHFSDGHILGSMCTAPHPIAQKAYHQFLDTNLGDPELFPGTKTMETKLIHYICHMLHAPPTADGLIVSGGTEGNISAIWIAKLLSNKTTILVPEHAHFSFEKVALLMNIKLKKIPSTKDYTVNIAHLKKNITNDVAAVVAIAGSTDLGTIDPIPEINDLCIDEHLFLHIDAAFGGFIIPYLKTLKPNIPDFDFRLKGVSTISVDAHKMGYGAIPLGTLIMREKQWIDLISVTSPCISSTRQAGILGTRSGGPVAAAYAVTHYLGPKGYQKVITTCIQNTTYFIHQIQKLGLNLLLEPTMNVIAIHFTNPTRVAQALAQQGWRVNIMEHLSSIRIVVMPQITKQIIDEFIPVLKKVCIEVGEL
ncbi:MAG: tyrosine decarboxylase MfnA [Candidatus Thermoplasmatota archaeon]|nr:tyrosine decarboxylase MfnA [Candidatus Thermoplasmatota archaeon]MBU1941207.1 tyrosine decarboxylase MfnA [Candidatus Thermoplasmatota archaeon]